MSWCFVAAEPTSKEQPVTPPEGLAPRVALDRSC
jgi:hypothetical protein